RSTSRAQQARNRRAWRTRRPVFAGKRERAKARKGSEKAMVYHLMLIFPFGGPFRAFALSRFPANSEVSFLASRTLRLPAVNQPHARAVFRDFLTGADDSASFIQPRSRDGEGILLPVTAVE